MKSSERVAPDRRAPEEAERDAVDSIMSAAAVRDRCDQLYARALAGDLDGFSVYPLKLAPAAAYVIDVIRANYPSLDIPFHARWRHFSAGGVDRWAAVKAQLAAHSPQRRLRSAFDLAIVSVLLDAGTGGKWKYRDGGSGQTHARSEGLALASLRMFAGGAFSSDPGDPLRVDATRLMSITTEDIAQGFQVGDDNPLEGLGGRVGLLRRLGEAVLAQPEAFPTSDGERGPGGLGERLLQNAGAARRIPAPEILRAVLRHLGPIWPGRLAIGGVNLGDAWRHPLVVAEGPTNGVVPFHKLSQWLSYSLIEPLQEEGATVVDIDALTGLPEYRNGGLFLDLGVIALKDPGAATRPHEVGSTLVVEWRALTVALLDRLADIVRDKLAMDSVSLPLAKVLEGGTWAAGRRIARERRADGSPPLTIVSDGTVF